MRLRKRLRLRRGERSVIAKPRSERDYREREKRKRRVHKLARQRESSVAFREQKRELIRVAREKKQLRETEERERKRRKRERARRVAKAKGIVRRIGRGIGRWAK